MITGCYTALVTPFKNDTVEYKDLNRLVDFQIENGISGILAVGTTGESPSLAWDEHNKIIENISQRTKNKCFCIAGTGSNNTNEAFLATQRAVYAGVDAVLLVDPYYNGPSSLEIRREYIAPIAAEFPDIQIIPYIIPGRTGTQLLPADIAILQQEFKNVNAVKEATGSLENMKKTRKCCGADFTILSGDDALTYEMMVDPEIRATGVISVVSNIAPGVVSKMVRLLQQGDEGGARKLMSELKPLFDLVTVQTTEKTPYGEVVCRARNPLATKVLMSILGMPSGGCRQPLGKITKNGLEVILKAARAIQTNTPEIFRPVAEFFGVDIEDRLKNPSNCEGLYYETY